MNFMRGGWFLAPVSPRSKQLGFFMPPCHGLPSRVDRPSMPHPNLPSFHMPYSTPLVPCVESACDPPDSSILDGRDHPCRRGSGLSWAEEIRRPADTKPAGYSLESVNGRVGKPISTWLMKLSCKGLYVVSSVGVIRRCFNNIFIYMLPLYTQLLVLKNNYTENALVS